MRSIHKRISAEKHLTFSQLLGSTREPSLVIVSFLAILELYKRRMIDVRQPESFGDISIDFIEGSGELMLVGEDAIDSVIEGE